MKIRLSVGLVALVAAIFFCSCTPGNRKENKAEASDSISVPPFDIEIKLSSRAAERLSRDKETIIIAAYFSGIPKDKNRKEYQDEGKIPLGSRTIELRGPGVAHFNNVQLSKKEFESLEDPDYEILINVYSGRHSSDLNLLNCDILEEPISKVKGTQHILHGDLIE